MKVNRKGYMLVEIIVAFVLAMTIVYYLLNLTFRFKNTNEDIFQSYKYMNDKIQVTRNIMSDLDGTILDGFVSCHPIEDGDKLDLIFKLVGETTNRGLSINYGDNSITYGATGDDYAVDGISFYENSDSYYKKVLEDSLVIEKINCEDIGSTNGLAIKVPISSIYDDNDYSIKIFVNK